METSLLPSKKRGRNNGRGVMFSTFRVGRRRICRFIYRSFTKINSIARASSSLEDSALDEDSTTNLARGKFLLKSAIVAKIVCLFCTQNFTNTTATNTMADDNHPDAAAATSTTTTLADDLAWIQRLVETHQGVAQFDGQSPLHVACFRDSLAAVQYYVETQGANVNATSTIHRVTPLHNACTFGSLEVVQYLVDKGANVTAVGFRGHTALHRAVRRYNNNNNNNNHKGNLPMVQCLVQAGASVTTPDADGDTPLEIAIARGNNDENVVVVRYLQSMHQLRQCHSLVLYSVQKGFWNRNELMQKQNKPKK